MNYTKSELHRAAKRVVKATKQPFKVCLDTLKWQIARVPEFEPATAADRSAHLNAIEDLAVTRLAEMQARLAAVDEGVSQR